MTPTERKRAHTPHQPVGRWIRPQKRLAIYLRDGFTCLRCGRDLSRVQHTALIHLDHIVPRSRGGSNAETNLFTSCQKCNSSRGDAVLEPNTLKLVRTIARRSLRPHLATAKKLLQEALEVTIWQRAVHRAQGLHWEASE